MSIGSKIKKLRKQNKFTQKELSQKANISRTYLADIENERYNPSLDVLKSIAIALDVPYDYLVAESARDIIERVMNENNITAEQLKKDLKISSAYIEKLDDLSPTPEDYEKLDKIARYLNIKTSILIDAFSKQEPPVYDEIRYRNKANNLFIHEDEAAYFPTNTKAREGIEYISKNNINIITMKDFLQIPIVGTVRAGTPILATDNIEGYHYTLKSDLCSDKEYFYLRVQGDSMNLEFKEGSLLLVEKTPSVENGSIAVVLIDGMDATVKKISQNKNMITLIPLSSNPEYIPHMYDIEKDKIQIVGKVKQAIKTY